MNSKFTNRDRRLARLSFERLEKREVFSGNVTASLSGGDLVITGDDQPNRIVVTQIAAGRYQVTAEDNTTVNGQSSKIISGVTDDIRIHLLRGPDHLTVQGVSVPDDLEIGTGFGPDQIVQILNTKIHGDLAVFTRDGNDGLLIQNVIVGKDGVGTAFIQTGDGNDSVEIQHMIVAGTATLRTGLGNDRINVSQEANFGHFSISADGGNDLAIINQVAVKGTLTVDMGTGNDSLSVDNVIAFAINLKGGSLNDRLHTANLKGKVTISGFEQFV